MCTNKCCELQVLLESVKESDLRKIFSHISSVLPDQHHTPGTGVPERGFKTKYLRDCEEGGRGAAAGGVR